VVVLPLAPQEQHHQVIQVPEKETFNNNHSSMDNNNNNMDSTEITTINNMDRTIRTIKIGESLTDSSSSLIKSIQNMLLTICTFNLLTVDNFH
jgi:hypothetical protein